jgi:hypothetical protein
VIVAWSANSHARETLFNFHGQALPSIGMYSDPVQICAHSSAPPHA